MKHKQNVGHPSNYLNVDQNYYGQRDCLRKSTFNKRSASVVMNTSFKIEAIVFRMTLNLKFQNRV